MNFQLTQSLPHWFKTQILRKKGLAAPQLYKKSELEDDTYNNQYGGKDGFGEKEDKMA